MKSAIITDYHSHSSPFHWDCSRFQQGTSQWGACTEQKPQQLRSWYFFMPFFPLESVQSIMKSAIITDYHSHSSLSLSHWDCSRFQQGTSQWRACTDQKPQQLRSWYFFMPFFPLESEQSIMKSAIIRDYHSHTSLSHRDCLRHPSERSRWGCLHRPKTPAASQLVFFYALFSA